MVQAGFHQVVVTPATIEALERRKLQRPDRPLWRISSTLFHHVASDNTLQPLERFQELLGLNVEQALRAYPPILAGKQVEAELQSIKLMQ